MQLSMLALFSLLLKYKSFMITARCNANEMQLHLTLKEGGLILLQNNMKEDRETNLASSLVWGFVPCGDLRCVRLRTEPSPFYLRIRMFCYDTFYLRLTGSACETKSCTL